MMIYVITDPDGKIVGTIRPLESKSGFSLAPPIPEPGQRVHELQLPSELEQISDPYELHRKLSELMQQ